MAVPEGYEPYLLLYDYNLEPTENTRYEVWDVNAKRVYRFANLVNSTCIYVEFDPAEADC